MLFRSITLSGEDITERFVRGDTSRNTEGSGLGLAIARSLVEQMGGSISAEYTDDRLHIWIFFRERGG